MLSAAAVEYVRLELFKRGDVLPQYQHNSKIVSLSVFWQIPQYLLVGLSEVTHPPTLARFPHPLRQSSESTCHMCSTHCALSNTAVPHTIRDAATLGNGGSDSRLFCISGCAVL